MKNILEMLENSAKLYPEKVVFSDSNESITYRDFVDRAKSIGSYILEKGIRNKPVCLLFERSIYNLIAMFGVLYSGNFYTVLDNEMPEDRMKSIMETLQPEALISSDFCSDKMKSLDFRHKMFYYNKIKKHPVNINLLKTVREKMIDTDPAYTLFTSGSTGVPKGAVVSHKSVIAYIMWYSKAFNIDDKTVFGSQTPFYFSMSVSDVFSTVYKGATLNIIPKTLFSFPVKLIEFLNQRKVNTIYWVPSALCIVANWKVLDYCNAEYIKTVLFAGEVMPVRQLNYWINKLQGARFANLFGPTETTDICTYYEVDRQFSDSDTLPIGKACENCNVFIVKDDGTEAKDGEEGELYVRGSFLALGYYNNPEKTKLAFVQNPLNSSYPETVYKTGDIVKINSRNELIYLSRADYQIKHMGYRIELGEIEAAAGAAEGIRCCAAIYDKSSDQIILIYEGKKKTDKEITECLLKRLPDYMMPCKYIRIKTMIYNQNGKIDRKYLLLNYKQL